jgi:hypothetical protein
MPTSAVTPQRQFEQGRLVEDPKCVEVEGSARPVEVAHALTSRMYSGLYSFNESKSVNSSISAGSPSKQTTNLYIIMDYGTKTGHQPTVTTLFSYHQQHPVMVVVLSTSTKSGHAKMTSHQKKQILNITIQRQVPTLNAMFMYHRPSPQQLCPNEKVIGHTCNLRMPIYNMCVCVYNVFSRIHGAQPDLKTAITPYHSSWFACVCVPFASFGNSSTKHPTIESLTDQFIVSPVVQRKVQSCRTDPFMIPSTSA